MSFLPFLDLSLIRSTVPDNHFFSLPKKVRLFLSDASSNCNHDNDVMSDHDNTNRIAVHNDEDNDDNAKDNNNNNNDDSAMIPQ